MAVALSLARHLLHQHVLKVATLHKLEIRTPNLPKRELRPRAVVAQLELLTRESVDKVGTARPASIPVTNQEE